MARARRGPAARPARTHLNREIYCPEQYYNGAPVLRGRRPLWCQEAVWFWESRWTGRVVSYSVLLEVSVVSKIHITSYFGCHGRNARS